MKSPEENEEKLLKNGWTLRHKSNTFSITSTGGMKDNKDKIDWTILPYHALSDVARVMMYGAEKYTRDNWLNVPEEEYIRATFRHLIGYINGEKDDKESEMHHLAHAACNILFALHHSKMKVDDR